MGWIQINCPLSLPFSPPATKLGQGNIFSSLCQEFCPQQGSAPLHAGIPPSPGVDTPLDQAPPRRSASWEIRATSGWYASYWNAILSFFNFCFPWEKLKIALQRDGSVFAPRDRLWSTGNFENISLKILPALPWCCVKFSPLCIQHLNLVLGEKVTSPPIKERKI